MQKKIQKKKDPPKPVVSDVPKPVFSGDSLQQETDAINAQIAQKESEIAVLRAKLDEVLSQTES